MSRPHVVMVWLRFVDVNTCGKHTWMLSGGTIGALSYGVVDRVEFYAQPACLSLVPWQQLIMATVSGLSKQHSVFARSSSLQVPFLNADAYGISRTNPLHRGPAG